MTKYNDAMINTLDKQFKEMRSYMDIVLLLRGAGSREEHHDWPGDSSILMKSAV